MARRPPASANPASAHFLAKPHFHPNVTFGDFTGTHPRARIGFRREFLPRTSEERRTNHNYFLDLRAANLPIGMSFSLPYRFLSFC